MQLELFRNNWDTNIVLHLVWYLHNTPTLYLIWDTLWCFFKQEHGVGCVFWGVGVMKMQKQLKAKAIKRWQSVVVGDEQGEGGWDECNDQL